MVLINRAFFFNSPLHFYLNLHDLEQIRDLNKFVFDGTLNVGAKLNDGHVSSYPHFTQIPHEKTVQPCCKKVPKLNLKIPKREKLGLFNWDLMGFNRCSNVPGTSTCGASPAMHHLRCITCGASPAVHHPYTHLTSHRARMPVYINIVFYKPHVLAPQGTTWNHLAQPGIT